MPAGASRKLRRSGSLIAANFVYNAANADGLTIGAIHPALYFNQLAGRPEVEYDWSKFAWIGSPATSNHLLYMRADSPYLTINHAVKATPPAKCGATATSSTAYYIPKLLEEVFSGIKGLAYRKNGEVVLTPARPVIANLNGAGLEKTLADNDKYNTVMSRCLGSGDEQPHVSWYVDPIALVRRLAA